jgi:NitT/TauT family transport system ATP-binding protein
MLKVPNPPRHSFHRGARTRFFRRKQLQEGSHGADSRPNATIPRTQVRITNLRVEFAAREGRTVAAIESLSFETQPHEFLCIVGASGCGKTTLLRAITGLLKPSGGKIETVGDGAQAPILLVPQEHNLFPWMTALNNAIYGLLQRGVDRRECIEIAVPLFKRMGLAGRQDAWPHELSMGMKQRVAVIRAFLSKPGMLLMDEPFAALDSQTREQLQQEMLDLWQESRAAVIFVTHDIDEAILLGQRILVLSGPPGHIASAHQVPFDYPRSFETSLLPEFVDLKSRVHAALRRGRETAHVL